MQRRSVEMTAATPLGPPCAIGNSTGRTSSAAPQSNSSSAMKAPRPTAAAAPRASSSLEMSTVEEVEVSGGTACTHHDIHLHCCMSPLRSTWLCASSSTQQADELTSAVAATAAELSLEPVESGSRSPPAYSEQHTLAQPTSLPAEAPREERPSSYIPLTAARPQPQVVTRGGPPPPAPPLPPASYKPAAKPPLCGERGSDQASIIGGHSSGVQATAVPQSLLLEIQNAKLKPSRTGNRDGGVGAGGADSDAAAASNGAKDLRR